MMHVPAVPTVPTVPTCLGRRLRLGARAGGLVYGGVFAANLATGGTRTWAYPDDACAQHRVTVAGVVGYPDCPVAARTRWPQRAINWPARALRAALPALGVVPQEFRVPPHGDQSRRDRWQAWLWIAVGLIGFVGGGALCGGGLALGVAAVAGAVRPSGRCPKATQRGDPRWATRVFATAAATAGGLVVVWLAARGPADVAEGVAYRLPEVRRLTRGPAQHFFGYYDKLQFDPTDRYVLGMATRTTNRAITPDDRVVIGMIDLEASDDADPGATSWIALGESRAWNWQQGCMLQWIPGRPSEIIWNDREGDGDDARFVARILDVETRQQRTIDAPIYALAPDGASALSVDFRRLQRARPTYGYVGVVDPGAGTFAPADDGVFHVELATGQRRLILSLADVVAFGRAADLSPVDEHYIEMVVINPSGTRFAFFERWGAPGLTTRVLTANLDGSGLFVLVPEGGHISHVAWLDDSRLVLYSTDHAGYAVFEDGQGEVSTLLETSRDGHESFFGGGAWMLTDTYAADDDDGIGHLLLYHLPTGTVASIGHFDPADGFVGMLRCDHHPRTSRDGTKVVIDSAHAHGRQMYLLDIGAVLDAFASQSAP